MIKIENDCVGCDVCYRCSKKQVEYVYCDECQGNAYYRCHEDGQDYCEECFHKHLNALLKDENIQNDEYYDIDYKASLLHISYKKY